MFRAAVLAGALLSAAVGSAAAQQNGVLIIDRDRVLSESAPALALRELERARREALAREFDEVRKSLEAEEAEIAAIRDELASEAFEERVTVFDQRVRDARRASQQANERLQAEIAAARRRLGQALNPVLQQILEARGASVLLNAQTVVMARGEIDVTQEAIERFSAIEIDLGLAPPAEPEGDGG